MKIKHINGKLVVDFTGTYDGGGVASQVSWHNPVMQEALAVMFAVKENEKVASIEVGPDGIKAFFEPK